jgi:hypothetical protein
VPRSTAPTRRAASATAASRAPSTSTVGEGAVGRAQPQRVGERALALPHLRAGVDVEQPQRLQQRAGAVAQRRLDLGGRHGGVDDQGDVDRGPREVRHQRRRHRSAGCGRGHQRVEVGLGGAGALRQVERGDGARVQLAGDTDAGAVEQQRGAAAGVPGTAGGVGLHGELQPERARDRLHGLDGVSPVDGAVVATARQHHAETTRLLGQGGVERLDLVGGGSVGHPGHARARLALAEEDVAGLAERDVGQAARGVAHGRGEQPGQQRRAQQRLLLRQRVEQPRRLGPAEGRGTLLRHERRQHDLDQPRGGQRARRRAAQPLLRRQPASGRATGSSTGTVS